MARPPTMGAAMRFMRSAPLPVLHIMGSVVQVGLLAAPALAQQADHRLRGGQITCALQHDQPFAGDAEQVQLAEGGDVIHTGIGARVGNEHQAIGQVHGNAVRHGGALCRACG